MSKAGSGSSSQGNQGNQADSVDPPISKKRRGRQPRPSLLTPTLLRAISTFTSVVGKPVLQPGGFRDYTGWLDSIASQRFHSAWIKLAKCFLEETKSLNHADIPQLKKDLVTEIMRMVVIRSPNESSKLVSTNARRQCAVPTSGVTVMTLLESYLDKASQPSSESRHPDRHQRSSDPSSASASSRPVSRSRGGSAHHNVAVGSRGRGHSHPSSHQSTHRQGSASSASRGSAPGMDISSLLVDDVPNVPRPTSSSSNAPKLPSLSQLDEQLRVRKEKDRRNPR